jgi:hypothetical protein
VVILDAGAEEPATTGEPEEDQVEFGAGEELDGDVEEAGIAGAEGEGILGEAVVGDVAEGRGEDGGLRVGVFVRRGVRMEGGMVWT